MAEVCSEISAGRATRWDLLRFLVIIIIVSVTMIPSVILLAYCFTVI